MQLNCVAKQSNAMAVHRVFVYGTLKKGEPNHNWINDVSNGKSTFMGEGKTAAKYPLIIATRYNIPFLLYQPGSGHNVIGEIYEVDEAMLEMLDVLEDHPNFYERKKEEIHWTTTNLSSRDPTSTTYCWVYFLKQFRSELLNLPMLECYQSKGGHGLPYCERYLRDPKYIYQTEVYYS